MFHILYGVCGIAATNVVEPGAGLKISFHLKFLPFSFVVVADIWSDKEVGALHHPRGLIG